jgi:uncharacterized protein (TIGR02118 family)
MVKLVYCLHRRDGMSLEEFQTYWRDVHAPLVRRHAEALGIRRYVQVHTRPSPLAELVSASRGGADGYDGVAELWFDDVQNLATSAASAEGAAAGAELLEDERRFIAVDRSPLFLAEENEVIASA